MVTDSCGEPSVDAKLELTLGSQSGTKTICKARADNLGRAELWIDPFEGFAISNMEDYTIFIDGQPSNKAVQLYDQGVLELIVPGSSFASQTVDFSFIIDATSSMSDELEFIKDDLQDVIRRVELSNNRLNIRTSTIFYRDEGDDYLVRKSDFTDNLNESLSFIAAQSAGGGGDYSGQYIQV